MTRHEPSSKDGFLLPGLSYPQAVRYLAFMYAAAFLVHFHKLVVDREWYFDTYSYMPPWMATLRYTFSWSQRIVGMAGVVGLLRFRDWGRWIIIGLSVFTATTVYWKHPYPAMLRHAEGLDLQTAPWRRVFVERTGFTISFAEWAGASVVVHCLINVACCAAVIWFLTRPQVKRLFR